MNSRVQRTGFFVLTSILTITFIGCDLINPPKKQTKQNVKKEQAQPVVDQGPLPSNVLVRVGTWSLTEDQFNERLKLLKEGMPDFDASKPGNKESVLNELIRQQLLVKDAEESGIGQQKEITDAVDDFRRTLMVQESANRLTKSIAATEKEAQDYYDQNKNVFVEPIEWKAREIIVADETTAKNVLVQILQGADFGETAKAQSKGKTAATGGVLAVFTKAPFAAMQTTIANLDVGGTSGVFKGPEGYYLVKVDEKKGGAAKAFADVKTELISGLTLRKQQQAILDHINTLAEKTKVEINKALLGEPATGK